MRLPAFVGADLADSSTWYGGPPELDGVVPMHHAQSLWDIRQCPNLYQLFAEFFGTPRLMVDINRCIFRPPVRPAFPDDGQGTIHWDTDPRGPEEPSLQAVVLLTDVNRNGGGFQCLPEIYRNLDAWLGRYGLEDDFNFFEPRLNHLKTTQIEGRAGDVILWSTQAAARQCRQSVWPAKDRGVRYDAAARRLRGASKFVDDVVAD